jgi:hypothetical protein
MNKNINIAELLKDCPPGMELYSPLCGKCVFDHINMGTIICKKQNTQEITFTSEGYYMLPVFDDCECMIFPSKYQKDWSKYQRPFKEGDVVVSNYGDIHLLRTSDSSYCSFRESWRNGLDTTLTTNICVRRLATEEEKQTFFQTIKDAGYKWNAETKTLEKLVKPKFKVGDIIQDKNGYKVEITQVEIDDGCYMYLSKILNGIGGISFKDQDDWELVEYQVGDHFINPKNNSVFVITKIQNNGNYSIGSIGGLGELCYISEMKKLDVDKYTKINKWNPKWLNPFDKVLIRDSQHDSWTAVLFSHIGNTKEFPYVTSYAKSRYCIPYNIETKHLVGTTLEEPEFYKL